jgi:hypothetical protein
MAGRVVWAGVVIRGRIAWVQAIAQCAQEGPRILTLNDTNGVRSEVSSGGVKTLPATVTRH